MRRYPVGSVEVVLDGVPQADLGGPILPADVELLLAVLYYRFIR